MLWSELSPKINVPMGLFSPDILFTHSAAEKGGSIFGLKHLQVVCGSRRCKMVKLRRKNSILGQKLGVDTSFKVPIF